MNVSTATPSQRDAIETSAATVVVAAGPGSGKSSTVVARINRLAETGINPKRIVGLSFTNSAANELARKLSGNDARPIELGFCGTLHSFSLRMLKEHGTAYGYGIRTAIIAPDAAADLMASKASSLGCKTPIEKLLKAKAANGRPPRGKRLSLDETVIATYLDELREAKVVDYDVLLHEFLDMLTNGTPRGLSAQASIEGIYSHLFVDESQDSSPVQWSIYRALPIPNKFYVGDTDQNLYEWNGARLREMMDEAAKPGVEVIKLEDNFRSRVEICDAAQRLIEHNVSRLAKKTISVSGVGGTIVRLPECENEGEEISIVAREIKDLIKGEETIPSIAVIGRTNDIINGFRRSLPSMGVPVVQTKRHALPRDWPLARALMEFLIDPDNDSLAYFYVGALALSKGATQAEARKIAQNHRTQANAEGKTINRKYFDRQSITKPESALAALVGAGVSREAHMIAVEAWRTCPPGATLDEFSIALATVTEYSKEEATKPGEVNVQTIHGAKGKEWDVVFFVGLEDQTLPGFGARDGREGVESERRCAYVAITRARQQLFLTSVKTRVTKWKEVVARTPSRFIAEILP